MNDIVKFLTLLMSFSVGLLVMRPLAHGELLVGQLLVLDSILLFRCLLNNRNARQTPVKGCIGVRGEVIHRAITQRRTSL